ncbi:MAG: DUF4430 domain-containing protein [Solirubrobacterales bacterium]
MRGGRNSGAGIALAVALTVAGCGLGPGKGLPDVRLTVTRDYGSQLLLERLVGGVTESDTAMRVLERSAHVSTRYGGGFVQSIDGTEGETHGTAADDWFYYVNGVESPVGATSYSLHGGEAIWWDYRDWSAAQSVPAVVGSWPEPFTTGYEGRRHPVAVKCMGGGGSCARVRRALAAAGAALGAGSPSGAIRVLVGPWAQLRRDPAAAQIEAGPQESGVFAEFKRHGDRFSLTGLGENGQALRSFGAGAGLVAATRRYEAPPTWLITGVSTIGVRAAAGLLNSSGLRDHYAVAIETGKETPLPVMR